MGSRRGVKPPTDQPAQCTSFPTVHLPLRTGSQVQGCFYPPLHPLAQLCWSFSMDPSPNVLTRVGSSLTISAPLPKATAAAAPTLRASSCSLSIPLRFPARGSGTTLSTIEPVIRLSTAKVPAAMGQMQRLAVVQPGAEQQPRLPQSWSLACVRPIRSLRRP